MDWTLTDDVHQINDNYYTNCNDTLNIFIISLVLHHCDQCAIKLCIPCNHYKKKKIAGSFLIFII
jgi:hypothetical protein